jgi:hypothetical protein
MARAPLDVTIRDRQGNVLVGVAVNLYLADTTTPFTVYDARTGGSVVAPPFLSNAEGQVTQPDGASLYANPVSADVNWRDPQGVWHTKPFDHGSATASAPDDASTADKGIVKLSVAPVDAANPIAVGDNDSRLGGGADASIAVKGVSKLSVPPVSGSNPIAVGDNDPRVGISAHQYGIKPTNSATVNLANLNSLIATLNASGGVVYFPPGTYDLNGTPIPLTGQNRVVIYGDGPHTTILRQTGASGSPARVPSGTFFTLGDGSTLTRYFCIRDLQLECTSPPPYADSVFVLNNMTDWLVQNIRLVNVASIIYVDSAPGTLAGARGTMENVWGSHAVYTEAGEAPNVMWFHRANDIKFKNVLLRGSGNTGAAAGLGRGIFFQPQEITTGTEGFKFTDCSIWDDKSGVGAGRTMDVDVVVDNGSARNIWFQNCDFDRTSLAAVRVLASSGATGVANNIKFDNCYFGSAVDGNIVKVSNSGPTEIGNVKFNNCQMAMRAQKAVSVSGSGPISDLAFYLCEVSDNDSTPKSAAMSFGAGTFSVIGCTFDLDGGATAYAIETTDTALDSFVVIGNKASGAQTGFMSHAAYAANSVKRVVRGNTVNTDSQAITAAGTITLPQEGDMVLINGAGTINTITAQPWGRRVILLFASTAAVSEAANVHLSGTGSFTGGADRTLTLVSNGSGWYETARSVN